MVNEFDIQTVFIHNQAASTTMALQTSHAEFDEHTVSLYPITNGNDGATVYISESGLYSVTMPKSVRLPVRFVSLETPLRNQKSGQKPFTPHTPTGDPS